MHSSSGSPFHFLLHVLEHLKWVNLMVAPISSLTVVTMVGEPDGRSNKLCSDCCDYGCNHPGQMNHWQFSSVGIQ